MISTILNTKDTRGHTKDTKEFSGKNNFVPLVLFLCALRVKKTDTRIRSMENVNFSKRERGQSLMELALSMTFILILLAGVVDLGRAFENAIIQRAMQTSNSPVNLSAGAVQFDVDVSAACAGGEVTVTATYSDFPVTMPFLGALIGRQAFDISASSTDDVLTPLVCAPSS
jgi:hypothetical protein